MKNLIITLLLLGLIATTYAQKLGNVGFEQKGNKVEIHYTMSGITAGQRFDVTILCSDNNGSTYKITPKHISNTGQNIILTNGRNTAVWEVRRDRNKLDGYKFVFQVKVSISIEPEMVFVKGGTFQMGSKAYDDEKPIHTVTVSDFYIGKYEITQKQWRAVMGSDPANLYFKGCDSCPVENVSWNDAQEFIEKLNTKTGKTYRLPTEAEWEYAAGGGANNRTKWAGTDSENSLGDYAWYIENSYNKGSDHKDYGTHEVGTKNPTALGIYDMSGNVWEWCQDKWHDNYKNAPKDGSAWESGNSSLRVARGGSWNGSTVYCRVADRGSNSPDYRSGNLGFRLVVVP